MEKTTDLKKLKRNSRIAGLSTLVALGSSAGYYANYLKEKFYAFGDYIDNEPEHYKMFSDLFQQYGCETKAEFKKFLFDNSYQVKGWDLVDGKVQEVTFTYYNGEAAVANAQYQEYMDFIWDYFLQDPNYFLELDPAITGLAIGAPLVVGIVWLAQRHKYKKARKEETEPVL